jgi:hypothetical protein
VGKIQAFSASRGLFLIQGSMKQMAKKSLLVSCKLAAVAAASLLLSLSSTGQTIPNPSFETDSFAVAPGFISDNAPITGWTTDNPAGAGLNPAGGESAFADTGAIPQGTNVAFIAAGTTLSTTVSGLTSGKTYKITLQVNATTNQNPILRANVDGADLLTLNVYTVGATKPYEYVAFEFVAAATTATLAFINDAADGSTLLIDNLTIAESPGRWEVANWNDDLTSGVDSQYVYTHAYSFGSSANALINGILFTGVPGVNPTVANKFSTAHFGNVFNNDANNVTGGSATLAHDFIYSGANVDSGDHETLTITNLVAGTEYVVTFYTMGWEDPSTSARWATFEINGDRLTINQDQFGNNNGLRISYRYTAGANGTAVLNISPVNPVNVSIHSYGFSNREAVSRNVKPSINVQPVSTTVAQGVPVNLNVAVAGFPAPTFQWRKNGANITTATTDTFSIAAAGPGDVGDYDVIVANSVGSVTSIVARVVVGLPMTNPSFEADSFVSWPGYSGDNPGGGPDTPPGPNGPITGWTQDIPESSGINPISNGQSPFADNGTIPNGSQVAFLQSLSQDTPITLSQTVDGLTVGSQYYIHFYENSRAATLAPALEVMRDADVATPVHSVPSGAYREVFSDVFTATATSLNLMFIKTSPSGSDTTLLLDNVAIVPVAAGTAPAVIKNPEATAAYVGGSVTFSAQVSGSLPLTYQWLKDGAPISGAATAELTLTNLQESAEGVYALRVTNNSGSVTTAGARLTINERIHGLFNTGVDDSDVALADGEIDPHYKLTVNPHVDSQDAIVEDSTVFPISDGTWLVDTAISKWIGPELNTATGAVGLYTYQLTVNLTGRDPKSVLIRGHWATDNAGREIRVNGVSIGTPESPGFSDYTPFAIYGTNTTFTAGTNTIDFIVENVDAAGYTGLRVEFLESNSLPGVAGSTQLAVTKTGDSISVAWSPTAAGQKLQSATNIIGPWSEVQNASNPYSTNTSGTIMFFRVSQ